MKEQAELEIQSKLGPVQFAKTKHGFLKQLDVKKFDYDIDYLNQQSTTVEMAYLRLGFLSSVMPYEFIRDAETLELGPGAGVFFNAMKNHCRHIEGFDVVQNPYSTITLDEVRSRSWDLLCGFDVIEHFDDIDDLWKINFRVGYFSVPALPFGGLNEDWRHFKPHEHVYYFTSWQFREWANANNYKVISCGCPEDIIRKRWNEYQPNINSFIIRRKEG